MSSEQGRQHAYTDRVAVNERGDVADKGAAATLWCASATEPTKTQWQYLKIPQEAFELLQPSRLADLKALHPSMLF
jgi:hypothetical protein